MATVLTLSSEVVRGFVGNTAARFVLQRLGHTVWSLPTVLLSNHPGLGAPQGMQVPAETLTAMVAALGGHGWLGSVDAVLTGYLPSPSHVTAAASLIAQVRAARPDAMVLVDPVLGDDPKGLYIAQDAAAAIRGRLLPLADIITPNRFELAWLTAGTDAPAALVREEHDGIGWAQQLGAMLPPPYVVATSIPGGPSTLATVLVPGAGRALPGLRMERPQAFHVARRHPVPNGTGDMLAAVLLGTLLQPGSGVGSGGCSLNSALAAAVAGVDAAIAGSIGLPDLDLPGTQARWAPSPPGR